MTDKERRTNRCFNRPSSSNARPPPPEMDRDPWPRERVGETLKTFEHYADPHDAVKDIKCTHREVKEAWDDYESLFYNEWLKVTIVPTRFIDWATIQRLGLETDLEEMIRELGLGTMAHTLRRPRLSRTVKVLGTLGIWPFQLVHSHSDRYPPSHRALLPQGPCQHAVVQDGTEKGLGTGAHTALLHGEESGSVG